MDLNREEAALLRAMMHAHGQYIPSLWRPLIEALRARGCLGAEYLLVAAERRWATDPAEAARLEPRETVLLATLDAMLRPHLGDSCVFYFGCPTMILRLSARTFVSKSFSRAVPDVLRHAGFLQLELKPYKGVPIEKVADNPLLGCTVDLSLTGWGLTDQQLAALLRSPHLGNVYKLNLGENNLTDDGVRALLASRLVERLTYLHLYRNRTTERGVRALAASSFLRHLQALSIGVNSSDMFPLVFRFPRLVTPYLPKEEPHPAYQPVPPNNGAWYWREAQPGPDGEFHLHLLHRHLWHMTQDDEPADCFVHPYQQLGAKFTEVREATFAYCGSAAQAKRALKKAGVVAVKSLYAEGVLDTTFTVGGSAQMVRLVCDTPAIRDAVARWLAGALPEFADWEDLRNHLARLNSEWYVELFRYQGRVYGSVMEGEVYVALPRLPKELASHLAVL